MVVTIFQRDSRIVESLREMGLQVAEGRDFSAVVLKGDKNNFYQTPKSLQGKYSMTYAWEMECGGGEALPGNAMLVCSVLATPLEAMLKPLVPLPDLKSLAVSGHFYIVPGRPFFRVRVELKRFNYSGACNYRVAVTRHSLGKVAGGYCFNSSTEFDDVYKQGYGQRNLDLVRPVVRLALMRAKVRRRLRLYYGNVVNIPSQQVA